MTKIIHSKLTSSHQRWKEVLLIAVITLSPLLAAYATYYVWLPRHQVQKGTNYGELIAPPINLADSVFQTLDRQPFQLSRLQGKWVMLQVDDSHCNAHCQNKLYIMRQIRLAQGKNMDRIERIWLLTDEGAPTPALIQDYRGTIILRINSTNLAKIASHTGNPTGNFNTVQTPIYLVDPLGKLMLRFPDSTQPKRMIKDLERLLKASRIG